MNTRKENARWKGWVKIYLSFLFQISAAFVKLNTRALSPPSAFESTTTIYILCQIYVDIYISGEIEISYVDIWLRFLNYLLYSQRHRRKQTP